MNNKYVKNKCNDKIYKALEVIAQGINSTNQENSALNPENVSIFDEMKTTKKLKND